MTLVQLEYIIAVDTYRHFATAAEKCFVTQPTLSMQIQKLEEELAAKIFDRSKQPVVPTELGESIIKQARIVIQETRAIRQIIQNQKEEISGELRLGIIPTLAPYLLPLFLNSFLARYSGIRVSITEVTTALLIEKLKKQQVDVGILATPLQEPGMFETNLFYEEFVVYASPGNRMLQYDKIDLKNLESSMLMLLQEGHCMRSQIVNLCQIRGIQQEESRLAYETGSIETLKRMVETNNGVTIIPELATLNLPDAGRAMIRRFQEPAPVREISLVTHRYYMKKRLTDALQAEILAAIPDEMKAKTQKKVLPI
jgi:LysR family transcriptional regulator, hydrogen peroxide-inducible genes activator